MKTCCLLFLSVLTCTGIFANDGSYYASGNHLVPMIETRISVLKEVLSVKKVNNNLEVNVYYEFYSPDNKTIDMGFEAAPPAGDVEQEIMLKKHPYIDNFSVNMNGVSLPFQTVIVNDSIYYRNGKFIQKAQLYAGKEYFDIPGDIKYVYHFKAAFKAGINKVIHTYSFRLSKSVDLYYDFRYILSAAGRWAGGHISDFTLNVDMGSYEQFNIETSFFKSDSDWKIIGTGMSDTSSYEYYGHAAIFTIQKGYIEFKQKNFKPSGELFLYTRRQIPENAVFDQSMELLPMYPTMAATDARDDLSLRILRNLPYARRGYVFKSADIRQYYESMPWYIPDPACVAELSGLSKEEQEWLKELKLVAK